MAWESDAPLNITKKAPVGPAHSRARGTSQDPSMLLLALSVGLSPTDIIVFGLVEMIMLRLSQVCPANRGPGRRLSARVESSLAACLLDPLPQYSLRYN